MKLTNNRDDAIMYSLNRNQYLHLKPQEFIFVPDVIRELYIKPTNKTYSLSIAQLENFPSGEVKEIIVDNDIDDDDVKPNTLVVAEKTKDDLPFLSYLVNGQRFFTAGFDTTDYDLKTDKIVIVDAGKLKKTLIEITNPSSLRWWWFLLMLFIIVVVVYTLLIAWSLYVVT